MSRSEIDIKRISGKYHTYIVGIYLLKTDREGYSSNDNIPFDKDDIEEVRKEFDLDRIKNVPDLVYNLRSRGDLPDELLKLGYEAVVQHDEAKRKDAAYLLTKEPDIIRITDYNRRQSITENKVPPLVEQYSSRDEQGILTRVRYGNLLSDFTSLDCYHLQSHFRTAGESGQIEIDDLYVAEDEGGTHFAIVVEGKGRDEKFSRNQIERNTRTVRSKPEYPDSVLTVGVKPWGEDSFRLALFNVPDISEQKTTIERVWEYTFSGDRQESLDSF